jgi:two-component system, OmpR family, phosphate regulon sensor histidine kinase PhoR
MSDHTGRDTLGLLQRIEERALAAWQRARNRQALLVACVVITAMYLMFGGLSARFAAGALATVVMWAGFWPQRVSVAGIAVLKAQRAIADNARVAADSVWKAIIETLPDPALALNRDGIVLALNALAREAFLGAQPGLHISQVTRAPDLLASVDAAMVVGEPQICRLDFKVPVERSLVGTVAQLPLLEGDDRSPRLLIVLRDLTEQDRLIRMRADFVANASHELRTPLASLKGFVETLQGAAKDDPEARQRFLKIMQQQSERMARLIDDLLSLSRIEMRAHVMPRESVDLGAIVAHVVQMLGPLAVEKSISVDVAMVPRSSITGDRDELIQVFTNLVENAIKYGQKGGRVRIVSQTFDATRSRAARISIAITDDGLGIAPEHLPRLTERFYRVNAAQSRNAGGTGLGLAIVKHVLNRHRADLQVDSIVGKGSTFRVSFPLSS